MLSWMPPVATDLELTLRRVMVAAVLLVPVAAVGVLLFAPVRALMDVLMWVMAPVTLAYVLVYVWADRRAKRRLAEADWLVCPVCRYDLAQIGLAGTCPECGLAYTQDELKELWARVYHASGLDGHGMPD